MIRKIKILFSLIILFFVAESILNAEDNFDDYNDLICYTVNSNISNRKFADESKKILKADSMAIDEIIKNLNTSDARTLWELRQVLIDIGEPAVPSLLNYISDTITYGNITAITIIGEINSKLSLNRLLDLSYSEFKNVRNAVCLALGNISSTESNKRMEKLLYEDTSPMIRKSAIVALSKNNNNDTYYCKVFYKSLFDTFAIVRFAAEDAILKCDKNVLKSFLLNKEITLKNNIEIIRVLSGLDFNAEEKEIIKTKFIKKNKIINFYLEKIFSK